MTTSLSGDLSHTPHPAFYITDTDFFLVGGWLGRLAVAGGALVCNQMCVYRDRGTATLLLLSAVHRGRFNEGPH